MKKKILSMVLTLCMVVSLMPAMTITASAAGEWEGSGTSSDPYLISNIADLNTLATNVNAGTTYGGIYFQMTNDITLNDGTFDASGTFTPTVGGTAVQSWTPIATGNTGKTFSGIFNGQDNKVKGLYVNLASDNIGLFGYVSSGTIKNVTVENSYIKGGWHVGGVVGRLENGTVSNCNNSGSIITTSQNICGGVIGSTKFSTVGYCNNTGIVNGSSWSGGVVGSAEYSNVTSCSNTGAVTAPTNASYTGGVIGYMKSGSGASNCYSTGAVSGGQFVGGVLGYGQALPVSNCYNMGDITSAGTGSFPCAGGIVGGGFGLEMTNCYNNGNVSGLGQAGGILGYHISGGYTPATIENCYSSATVTSSNTSNIVGGLVGYAYYTNSDFTMKNSYWNKEATVTGSGLYVTLGTGCTGKTTSEMQDAAFVTLLNNNAQTYNTAAKLKACLDWVAVSGSYPKFGMGYMVNFNRGSGAWTALSPYISISTGNHLAALPSVDPTSSSYRFDGWYTAASGGEKFTTATEINADMTVYAQWCPILKSTTTVKGVTVTNFGTSSTVLSEVTPGAVSLTAAKAADTIGAATFVTNFIPTLDPPNMTTKAVKYASGADPASFETDAPYNNEAIANGDFFVIKVIATDDSSYNYFKIAVSVEPSISPTGASFDKYTGSVNNTDITVTKADNGSTLNAIKNGPTTLTSGSEYTISGDSVTIKKAYLATLATGTATITFDYSSGTNPVLSINIENSAPTPETTPGAIINYTSEKLTGLIANRTYTVNGSTKTADASGMLSIESGWLGTTLNIVKTGNGTTTTNSGVQTLAVPVRPTAPSVTGNNPTVIGGTGTITGVNNTMEYKSNAGSWTDISGTSVTSLAAGTCLVRVKASAINFVGEEATVTITAFVGSQETVPSASIEYANEKLTGLVANGAYTVNGAAKTADGSGKITIESGWMNTTISIVKTGNGTTTTNSTAQSLAVPARPAASSPSTTNPTTIGGTGSINDVDDTMEYSSNGTSWTAVTASTASVGGLTAGTYYVRVKSVGSSFAGANATVTITAFGGSQETVPSASIDYANEQLTDLVTNGSYTVNGAAKTADGSGKITIESGWMNTTISIVKTGNGGTTSDSSAQTISVPAKPAAPPATRDNPTTIGATGSINNVDDTMEYSSNGSDWTAVPASTTSIGGLSAGTYYVRVKLAGSNFAGTSTTLTITAFGAASETTPTASADYAAEKLTGLTPSEIYIIGGAEYTSDGSGELSSVASWLGTDLSIVKKGNGLTTTNSDAQSVTLAGRPGTPIAGTFAVTQPSTSGAAGTIAGISTSMQYSTNAGINWTDGTGDDLSEIDGTTVGIRVKATGAAPCSLTYSISLAYTTGSSGGGGSSTPATTIINTNTGSVTGNQLKNAAEAAKDGGTVTIKSDKTNEVSFSNSGLNSLAGKNNSLTVVTENGTLTFDSKAVGAIGTQATATDIKVIVDNVVKTTLTEEQQIKVRDKTVYDLTVMSGGKIISSFHGGKVNVSIPYELKTGETAENLTVWYMADDGSLTEINCTYDAKNKSVTFVVDHFSNYLIGYDGLADWVNPFTDVKSSAWYYDAVAFVNTNGLMKGQTDTAFGPQTAMTRGMFVTILGRMEGIDATVYASKNTFSDVKSNQYYAPYIAWANDKGIVTGMGGDKFAPNAAVTREQMAVMMTNYIKFKGQGPAGAWAIQLTYSDLDQVSSWADEAVMFMTMKDLMKGMGNDTKGNPLFAPKSTSTRAQTAQVMMSLGELVK